MSPKRAESISSRLRAPPMVKSATSTESAQAAGGPGVERGARRRGEAVPHMPPERAVELVEPARAVGIFQRRHFLEQVGMAADRALAELDQAARDDIGAFDRDADGHRAVEAAEIVVRAFLHALAAVHVERVVG